MEPLYAIGIVIATLAITTLAFKLLLDNGRLQREVAELTAAQSVKYPP